jgi:outer membrane receptor protein involved in Fe transport
VPPPFGPINLPRTVSTYLNLAGTRSRGVEASVDHTFTNQVSAYANYSFQDTPDKLEADEDEIETPTGEIAIPPRHRFNVGLNLNTRRFVGNASVNYADKAFHTDVLTADYDGWTDAYTLVNGTFGVKWAQGRVVTSLKGTNLLNEKIQQHTFGDVLRRSIFAEVKLHF